MLAERTFKSFSTATILWRSAKLRSSSWAWYPHILCPCRKQEAVLNFNQKQLHLLWALSVKFLLRPLTSNAISTNKQNWIQVFSISLRQDRDERWMIILHKLDAQRATTHRQVLHHQQGFLVCSPRRMKFCAIQNFCSRTAYMGITSLFMCAHMECHFQAANRLYQNA